MRRKFGYILLSFLLLAGTGNAFADRNDHRGGKDRQEQRNTRPGNKGNGNNNRGNGNNGWGNGNKHNNNNKHNDKHKDNGNKHNDKFLGRPGGNNGHGNMNQGRPGGNNVHHPAPAPAPRPDYGHPAPPPAPHHPAPAPAPVVRPGAGGGFHYGPALPPPPPRLPYMVDYATRGCRDVSVWQVDNDTFLVKYWRAGRWYTQYIYPYTQQYSTPTLISVNWQPMSPWTLIPPIQLNINL